jgi:hypothetical protein
MRIATRRTIKLPIRQTRSVASLWRCMFQVRPRYPTMTSEAHQPIPQDRSYLRDVGFVVITTLLFVVGAALVRAGHFSWIVPGAQSALQDFYEALDNAPRIAFGIYQLIAVVLSIVWPAVLCVRNRQQRKVVRILAGLVLTLLWQIVLEALLARFFFANSVVFIGWVYSIYRVFQLREAQRVLLSQSGDDQNHVRDRSLPALLLASKIFWCVNIVFLTVIMMPRVVRG